MDIIVEEDYKAKERERKQLQRLVKNILRGNIKTKIRIRDSRKTGQVTWNPLKNFSQIGIILENIFVLNVRENLLKGDFQITIGDGNVPIVIMYHFRSYTKSFNYLIS